MQIQFSEITNKLPYTGDAKSTLALYHAAIVSYGIEHFDGTAKFKKELIGLINSYTAMYYNHDMMPKAANVDNPFNGINLDQDYSCTPTNMLVKLENIRWDNIEIVVSNISPNASIDELNDSPSDDSVVNVDNVVECNVPEELSNSANVESTNILPQLSNSDVKDTPSVDVEIVNNKNIISTKVDQAERPTPKQDLYLSPPKVPSIDFSRVYMSGNIGGNDVAIYYSLPEIPTCQNEISITTDVSKMTTSELLNLYPNRLIPTRYVTMYQTILGTEFDDNLGTLTYVEGYTLDQIRDNIIKYPHFYKMYRVIDGEFVSFYKHIEIDGELYPILEAWNNLPEANVLPRNVDVMKDYVVRRYLLERDVKHIKHKFPLFGEFNPFLTLFMPMSSYISYGYTDVVNIAKQCVESRVAFRRSHNPIYRRLVHD